MGRSRSLLFVVCAAAVILASIGAGVAFVHARGSKNGEVELGKGVAPVPVGSALADGRAAAIAKKAEHEKMARAFESRLESARTNDSSQKAEVYFRRGPQILDEMMQQQEPDEAWATEVTAAAREIFEQRQYRGTTFQEVECRGALCRMALRHSSEAALGYFRDKGSNEAPWEGDQIGVHRHLPDGTIESTVYFSDPSGDPEPFREMREIMKEEQP
jgi:hypothetical protein